MSAESAQGEPSLRVLSGGVPDRNAIDATIPDTELTRENNLDLTAVSHVVIKVSDSRQQQVFRSVGYQFDSDRPSPFWYFLGKIAAQALYDKPAALALFNFVRVRDREFIAFTTDTGATNLNVVEVDIKKPQPGMPMQLFCRPARTVIAGTISKWIRDGRVSLSAGNTESRPE